MKSQNEEIMTANIPEVFFRGRKLERGGTWAYGDYLQDFCGYQACIRQRAAHGTPGFCEVHPATVGQYARRNDIHGKPAFDGDIISDEHTGLLGIVVVGEIVGVRCAMNSASFDMLQEAYGLFERFEVLGNIHENPELAEKVEADE